MHVHHKRVANTTEEPPDYMRGLEGVDVPQDILFERTIITAMGFLAIAVLFSRLSQLRHAYLRHVSSLGRPPQQQTFWGAEDSQLWPGIKKHLVYAPLGSKRHNREFQLSSSMNVGTLPSRFHIFLIGGYIASQIAFCCMLSYDAESKGAILAELRGRSGVLAVLNMVPLFIFAGRNNPLIPYLQVSFDTYNLFHRWLGRIVAVESVIHTIAWVINAVDQIGYSAMIDELLHIPFLAWGFVGTLAGVFLVFQSLSPIRHAFYETFLHLHQVGAVLVFLGVWYHIKLDGLPQKSWLIAIAVLWALERVARLARLIYLNFSVKEGSTKIVVTALPGDACKVTFHLPKRVSIRAGSHVYAYIPSISQWMSHPFSVAWVEDNNYCVTSPKHYNAVSPSDLEKQSLPGLEDYLKESQRPTSVSLIVGARQGMTRKLYKKASACPKRTLYTMGYIEGPYGGHFNADSYGTAVFFSAGAGVTHHLLYTRDLIIRAHNAQVATQKIHFIWSVRSTEHLSWVQEWMNQILSLPGRRQMLHIQLFVSKPKSQREIVSPSASVQMFPGRCRPEIILDKVIPQSINTGATLVSVCGPGAFADEVRAATRRKIGKGAVVDFVEEAFTW